MKIAHRIVRTSVLAAALCAGALTIAPAAQAQMTMRVGGPGPGGGGASVSRSSLDRYEKLLGLSAVQKQTVDALFDAYVQESQAGSKEMRDAMKSLHEGMKDGDMSVLRDEMPKIVKKYGEKAAARDKGFLDDVKAVLTPAQADNWPRVERLRRREQWLRFGMVSGSSVDLTALVDSLKLDASEQAKLATTLDEYEQSMDRLLQEREHEAEAALAKDAGPQAIDMDAIQASMKKDREQAMKVREVNQRYARVLASLLPEDKRATLEEQFKAKSFRQVYGPSSAERKLNAAEKLGTLTPEQKQRLSQIRDSYKQAARPLNDRWAAAQEKAENEGKAGGFPFMMLGGQQGAPQQDEELASARTARRELDKKTSDQLSEVLTPEQRDQMPTQRMAGMDGMTGDFHQFIDMDGAEGDIVFATVDAQDMGEGGMAVQSVIIRSSEESGPGSGTIMVKPGTQSAPAPKSPSMP